MNLCVQIAGTVPYKEALDWQYELMAKRRAGEIDDTLLLLEHPAVLTTGRRKQEHNILIDTMKNDIEVIQTNRGGEVTYHGPGQIVGYLIIDLAQFSRRVKLFVENLEKVFINLLAEHYDIEAQGGEKHRGVWVGDSKITAIGLAIEKEITMHGFAFNINTNLEHFQWIVPCGIQDKGVCSLESLTGKKWNIDDVYPQIVESFINCYNYESVEVKYGRN